MILTLNIIYDKMQNNQDIHKEVRELIKAMHKFELGFAVAQCILSWERDGGPENGPTHAQRSDKFVLIIFINWMHELDFVFKLAKVMECNHDK